MSPRITTRAAIALAGLVLCGCTQGRGPHLQRAGAPSLDSERNTANPNAPFLLPAEKPALRTREPVLDVNAADWCSETQLSLFESRAQSSGIRHTLQYTVRNGGPACRLGGFPSISLLHGDGSVAATVRLERVSRETLAATLAPGAAGALVAPAAVPTPHVLLPAHGSAAFQLGWVTGPDCERISRIAIAAPGSTRPVVLARPMVLCEDRILVTAIGPASALLP